MKNHPVKLPGGCLCGEIRFEIEAHPNDVVDYCHCSQCRKASGSPLVAWIQVRPARFRLVTGIPRFYRSSIKATRWFCGTCGSPLYMTDPEEHSVGVPLGTLDDPNAIRPTVHGWTGSAVSWLALDYGLPRYPEHPPYD